MLGTLRRTTCLPIVSVDRVLLLREEGVYFPKPNSAKSQPILVRFFFTFFPERAYANMNYVTQTKLSVLWEWLFLKLATGVSSTMTLEKVFS